MSVKIELKFPDLAELIRRNEEEINRFIAAQMQFNRGMLFDKEGAYNGHEKWAPLAFRSGQILSQRGILRKSIAPYKADGTSGPNGFVKKEPGKITIGTNLYYAAMMNYGTTNLPGGVLKPKNAKALKIPIPQGRNANENSKNIQKQALLKKYNEIKTKKYRGKKGEVAIQKQLFKIRGRLLNIDKGNGPVKFIFAKSVKIPARRFDEWNDQDAHEMSEALCNKLVDLIRKGR